jgi:hypothetical protein
VISLEQIQSTVSIGKEGSPENDDKWVSIVNYILNPQRTEVLSFTAQHNSIRQALQKWSEAGLSTNMIVQAHQAAVYRSILDSTTRLQLSRNILWPFIKRQLEQALAVLQQFEHLSQHAVEGAELIQEPADRWNPAKQQELESFVSNLQDIREEILRM